MFKKFLEKKKISADEFTKLEAEKQMELQNEYLGEIEDQVGKALSKDDYEVEKAQMNKDVQDLAEEVRLLNEQIKAGGMTDELKDYLHSVLKENHKAIVDAVKNRKEIQFEVAKVAAMHMTNNGTVTNVSGLTYPTNPNFLVDNNVAYIRVPENFILSVIPNRQVDKVPEQIIKKQQLPREGDIAITAEGAVKPLVQYKMQNTATTRNKWAGRIEWSEEFAIDFEALFADIVRMFERDVLTE